VLVLVRVLLGPVARQPGHGAAHRPGHAVAHARRQVVELPARFLLLAGAVLLAPGLLEVLWGGGGGLVVVVVIIIGCGEGLGGGW
jgi:hypothetical protein